MNMSPRNSRLPVLPLSIVSMGLSNIYLSSYNNLIFQNRANAIANPVNDPKIPPIDAISVFSLSYKYRLNVNTTEIVIVKDTLRITKK